MFRHQSNATAADRLPAVIRLGSRVLLWCDLCAGWHQHGRCDDPVCWCGLPFWVHANRPEGEAAA